MTAQALFIYIGTIIVKFDVEILENLAGPVMTWKTRVTSDEMLKKLQPTAYKNITQNIKDLNEHNIITEGIVGNFHKVSDTKMDYKYSHKIHAAFSRTKFTAISQLCEIIEKSDLLSKCERSECHDSYFSYCYGNSQLQSILNDLIKNQSDDQKSLEKRIKTFQTITSAKKFNNTSKRCRR